MPALFICWKKVKPSICIFPRNIIKWILEKAGAMEPGLFLLCLWSLWYGRDRAGLAAGEACAGCYPRCMRWAMMLWMSCKSLSLSRSNPETTCFFRLGLPMDGSKNSAGVI